MRSNYRWVMVFAGGLMGCVAIGVMFSLAVFLEPIARQTGWSHAAISSAMTLNFIVMGLGSFLWGAASDRYGTRIVVTIGAVLAGLSLVLASRVESLLAFQITYGCLVGLSASAFMAPMISLTMRWFDTRRSLAVSLLPAVLLVRNPPAEAEIADGAQAEGAGMPLGKVFRSPQFLALAFTFFACCAAHSGPIFHMVSYAMFCGVTPMAAVSIYSVEGAAGLGGRIVYGLLADRLGVKPVLMAGLLIQALVIAAYTLATDLTHFYLLAIIFGGTYGGVMPLYAVLAREYFGAKILGTVLGAASMLSSIGMAFGPLAGGWAFDAFNNYNWLFLGSALVGLGAVVIALAFPPLPVRETQKLQPA